MVSFLVGKSYVTEDDMKEAKAVLSKMYVGFSDKMKVSLQRFGKAFGWTKHKDWDKCMASFVDHGSNRNNHPHVNKDSLEWRELVQINKLDMELFNFAEQLFEEQGRLYFNSRSILASPLSPPQLKNSSGVSG
jgi:hypothetical protein